MNNCKPMFYQYKTTSMGRRKINALTTGCWSLTIDRISRGGAVVFHPSHALSFSIFNFDFLLRPLRALRETSTSHYRLFTKLKRLCRLIRHLDLIDLACLCKINDHQSISRLVSIPVHIFYFRIAQPFEKTGTCGAHQR